MPSLHVWEAGLVAEAGVDQLGDGAEHFDVEIRRSHFEISYEVAPGDAPQVTVRSVSPEDVEAWWAANVTVRPGGLAGGAACASFTKVLAAMRSSTAVTTFRTLLD